jgi:carbamoyltransferase
MNAEPGEHCSVPGKLMGYASWGKYRPEHEKWLVDNEYFRQSWGARHDFIEKATADFRWNGNFGNNKDSFLFDIAATMQEIFRKGILGKIKNLALETGAEYLYYAGGCALNIVANADLVSENWFKDVFISPCCNDSGLSIGASAYWAFLNKRELKIESPYSNTWGTQGTYSFSMEDIIQTATNLVDGKVVGVCNGFGEAGPRALGNRSILSLANSKSLSEHVSMVLKEREWYRPVAPIMQEKNAMLYTGLNKIHHLSKYMLLDFQILTEYHRELQGVVHSNGTARIQTVFSENDNPFIFHLLKYLDEQLGIRALINTSFNGKGEPIVQTSEHAIESAIRMKLDGIVINGKFQNL